MRSSVGGRDLAPLDENLDPVIERDPAKTEESSQYPRGPTGAVSDRYSAQQL
jgi:hypothetical protein